MRVGSSGRSVPSSAPTTSRAALPSVVPQRAGHADELGGGVLEAPVLVEERRHPGGAERRAGVAGEHREDRVGGADRRQREVAQVAVGVEDDVVVVGQQRPQDPPDAGDDPALAASVTPTCSSDGCAGSRSRPGATSRPQDRRAGRRRVTRAARRASRPCSWRRPRTRARGVLRVGVDGQHPSRAREYGGEVGGGRGLADATLGRADGQPHRLGSRWDGRRTMTRTTAAPIWSSRRPKVWWCAAHEPRESRAASRRRRPAR